MSSTPPNAADIPPPLPESPKPSLLVGKFYAAIGWFLSLNRGKQIGIGVGAIVIVFLLLRLFSDGHHLQGRVLIIEIEEERTKSFGIPALTRALANGGQVTITVADISEYYPSFEKDYAVLNADGKRFEDGAVINFVVDQGWRFHSRDLAGLVFVKP